MQKLIPATKSKIKKAILAADAAVSQVSVRIGTDFNGDDTLFIRIVLKDASISGWGKASRELGRRLQRISTVARNHAARTNPQLFASIDFLAELEISVK